MTERNTWIYRLSILSNVFAVVTVNRPVFVVATASVSAFAGVSVAATVAICMHYICGKCISNCIYICTCTYL